MNKLLLTFFAGAALCLAADPFVGTWKSNAAKMKMSPGGAPGRETWAYTFEAQGKNQYHVTVTGDGKTQSVSADGMTLTETRRDGGGFRPRD